LKNRNLFKFNRIFLVRFLKIVFASIMMGIFFKYLIVFFENQLVYSYNFKSFYLILSVLLGLVFYILMSLFIKAFNYKDLQLKY
jgi:putative peptidoglycan lipid II flippase